MNVRMPKPDIAWVIRAKIVVLWEFGHGGLQNRLMTLSVTSGGKVMLPVTGYMPFTGR